MPLQNRVMPTGEIVETPARGTLTGNRGILHGADRRLGPARWRHKAWISCCLHWKETRRVPMTPGTWTELFFLDEAVALAAGHRPCALCRRPAYRRFQAAWAAAHGPATAPVIDAALHTARLDGRTQRRFMAATADLPDGAFVLAGAAPHLKWAGYLVPWTPAGYGPVARPAEGQVTVLTPAPILPVLAAGYAPLLHASLESRFLDPLAKMP